MKADAGGGFVVRTWVDWMRAASSFVILLDMVG